LPEKQVYSLVDLALREDLGRGDVTTEALIQDDIEGKASFLIKADGVIAGGGIAEIVFHRVDLKLKVELLKKDGTVVKAGDIIGIISGKASSILKGERVALNFMQRLSGVASLTAKYVAEVRGTNAGIYDTRKTTPGFRFLEKYAVRMGGGRNHRLDLGDFVLIKDNHIAILRRQGLSLTQIVEKAKKAVPAKMKIEVETTTVEDSLEAARAGADIVMFDNMSPGEMKRGVEKMPPGVETEASGSITLVNVRQAALSGVDIISIGALTHSAPVLDISLELEL